MDAMLISSEWPEVVKSGLPGCLLDGPPAMCLPGGQNWPATCLDRPLSPAPHVMSVLALRLGWLGWLGWLLTESSFA